MADVFLHRIPATPDLDLVRPDLSVPLGTLTGRLSLDAGRRTSSWALKVEVGPRGRRPRVDPGWARAVADAVAGPGAPGVYCFDTLSITTKGLEAVESHLDTARDKGYGADVDGPPFVVADGPDQGEPVNVTLPDSGLEMGLAAGAVGADGLVVLNTVRPHPHLGFQGAVASLGLGLLDRAGKIAVHEDIRPSVDTPLCAGCGSCLDVCIFDAIIITAGRAHIDHAKCTGCGECMSVCFMAGIAPEDQAGVPRFQGRVAEAAWSARNVVGTGEPGRAGYFNFLVGLGERGSGARARKARQPGDIGILASTDPVACDQAAWDLVTDRIDGPLHEWVGYRQEPGALLDRAGELGLGARKYRLVQV